MALSITAFKNISTLLEHFNPQGWNRDQALSPAQEQDPLNAFMQRIEPHIQKGTIHFKPIRDAYIQRERTYYAGAQPLFEKATALVEQDIHNTMLALPESQRRLYAAHVQRAPLVQDKLRALNMNKPYLREPALDDGTTDYKPLRKATVASPFEKHWVLETIAATLKDPVLEKLAARIEPEKHSDHVQEVMQQLLSRLAADYASESPDHLAEVLDEYLSNKDEVVFNRFELDDAFFAHLKAVKVYPDDSYSRVVYHALEHSNIRRDNSVQNYTRLFAQLNSNDLREYQYAQVVAFASKNLSAPSYNVGYMDLQWIEGVLNLTPGTQYPAQTQKDRIWRHTDGVGTSVEQISRIMLTVYSPQQITPMVEAYQGQRILDGGLSRNQLVSEVRPYLDQLAATVPHLSPEKISPLDNRFQP